MKSSIIILISFISGVLLAVFKLAPGWLASGYLSFFALLFLVFLVGTAIGSDSSALQIIRKINCKVLLVPLVVITGSIGGSALFSIFFYHLSIGQAMAVGAGFGYYSLSSIIISQMGNHQLGVIALLANVFREIFTLVAAPFIVRYFGKLALVTTGGATSMDTSLPVIVKFSGKEFAIIAVVSGVILSFIVPVLIPLIFRFIP